MSDEQDELIERIAGRLRPLPDVDPAARARVLVAVAAERERDRERAARRRPLVRWLGAAVVAATLVTALMLGRNRPISTAAVGAPTGQTTLLDTPATGTPAATLARRDESASASARQPVQLVFRAPNAKQVSVVGDFTGWDPTRAVMTRDSGSGLWTVTLSLPAGRHVYAFLVDDSVWVRDPRAPAAPDADFGRPGSVLLVGRP